MFVYVANGRQTLRRSILYGRCFKPPERSLHCSCTARVDNSFLLVFGVSMEAKRYTTMIDRPTTVKNSSDLHYASVVLRLSQTFL